MKAKINELRTPNPNRMPSRSLALIVLDVNVAGPKRKAFTFPVEIIHSMPAVEQPFNRKTTPAWMM